MGDETTTTAAGKGEPLEMRHIIDRAVVRMAESGPHPTRVMSQWSQDSLLIGQLLGVIGDLRRALRERTEAGR